MIATRVGYAGGTTPAPDYHHTGDHLEAVEVTYDPARISYGDLLAAFWRAHPATFPQGPQRVHEAVLYADEAQRRQALGSRQQVARRAGAPVTSGVLPVGTFHPAEAMHQKFHLQKDAPALVAELGEQHGGRAAFLATTAAARLNAYLGGFAGEEAVAAAAAELGLPAEELHRRLGR